MPHPNPIPADVLKALLADSDFWANAPQEEWSQIIHNIQRMNMPVENVIQVSVLTALIMLEVMKKGWSAYALADQLRIIVHEAQLWLTEDE